MAAAGTAPRRNTVGEVTVYRFHDDDDDSSDTETVSEEDMGGGEETMADLHGLYSSPEGLVPAEDHSLDHHDAAMLRGQPQQAVREAEIDAPLASGLDFDDAVRESLELSLGTSAAEGGDGSFSFAAASVVLDEDEGLDAAGGDDAGETALGGLGRIAADEVGEEPSLVHMHRQRRQHQQQHQHDGPYPEQVAAESDAGQALHPEGSSRSQGDGTNGVLGGQGAMGPQGIYPASSPDSYSSAAGPGAAPFRMAAEDSMLLGSVVAGGPNGEDSVLYGSPIRRVGGTATGAGSGSPAAAGVRGSAAFGALGYYSVTSPLRAQLPLRSPHSAAGVGPASLYFPEPNAIEYSPER